MNLSDISTGGSSFAAAGFVRTVFLNQLGFDLKRAVFQAEKKDTPVFDARIMAAMGDNGLPEVKQLNADQICDAMAAAFVLVTRHVSKPDPETGRKPEWMAKLLRAPANVIEEQVNWRLTNSINAAKATAASLGADPTKRIEVIRTEMAAQAAVLYDKYTAAFAASLSRYVDDDDESLVDVCCEALVDAGRDPTQEVKRAALAYLERQKERFETDGGYVAVDAGIYALSKL